MKYVRLLSFSIVSWPLILAGYIARTLFTCFEIGWVKGDEDMMALLKRIVGDFKKKEAA